MADNDLIRLKFEFIGTLTLKLSDFPNLRWPPSRRLVFLNGSELRQPTADDHPATVFRRVSMSRIDSDKAERMDGVARVAVYQYENTVNKGNQR